MIKGGILAYKGVAELGEAVGDIMAEAQAELAPQHSAEAERPKPSTSRRRQHEPKS